MSLAVEFVDLPVEATSQCERPSVTALGRRPDGSFYCGLLFAHPCLLELRYTSGKGFQVSDLGLESDTGEGLWGVTGGLRETTSGDTAFAVIQSGFAPGFLKKLAGGDLQGLSGVALLKYLLAQDGGMGASLRHSVVQIVEGERRIRRFREPGALLDVAHIGDFIFGLCGSSIWREPYLNTEKRETLRKDLSGNLAFHRDGAGNFWMQGAEGRLLRMGQMDIKAKPTARRLPEWRDGMMFEGSAASPIDEWLYGVTGEGRTLFRVRVNPVSGEEELEVVKKWEERITSLAFREKPRATVEALSESNVENAPAEADRVAIQHADLLVSLEGKAGARLEKGRVQSAEDPEMSAPHPEFVRVGEVEGCCQLSQMMWDKEGVVWAGEGRVGWGALGSSRKPRVLRMLVS